MSFFPTTDISFADSEAIDAYARLRVSNPTTEFESKLLGDKNPLVWDDVTAGVGALATYEVDRSTLVMSVPVSTISSVVRQSKTRSNFHPGKSHEVLLSFCMDGTTAGVTKEAGYNDAENGILLQLIGNTVQMTRRTNVTSSVVDNRVLQAAWNKDKFDGTGPSGETIDWTKCQTMFIDFEWPTGRIRTGFVIDGKFWEAHEFHTANVLDRPSFGVSDLPIRYRIDAPTNVLQASTMQVMASSVSTEGGTTETGQEHGINRLTYLTTTADVAPIMLFRHKAGMGFVNFIPTSLSIVCPTTAVYEWALILNPTIVTAGSGAVVWTDVGQSSLMQKDISSLAHGGVNTVLITAGTGTKLMSGMASSANNVEGISFGSRLPISIGETAVGVSDIIALTVTNVAATAETFHASFNWTEVR